MCFYIILLILRFKYFLQSIILSDERVSTDLKKNIMQARLDKKLTQAQLAQVLFLHNSLVRFLPYVFFQFYFSMAAS
jgi:hypothetical protein